MLFRGSALPEDGNPTKLSAQDIVPLDVARVSLPSLISVKVFVGRNGMDRAAELRRLFERKPGETQVRLIKARSRARFFGDPGCAVEGPSGARMQG